MLGCMVIFIQINNIYYYHLFILCCFLFFKSRKMIALKYGCSCDENGDGNNREKESVIFKSD